MDWLKVDTISMFAKESLLSFSSAKKDVLYDLLNREDLNWRKLQLYTAKKLIKQEGKSKVRAFVVDDSVKQRRGKKMPGVSTHFDHLTGRCVMGQQVLSFGYASDSQFVPLDNELFISQTKAQPLTGKFKDERSIVAKRYKQSVAQTKPAMVAGMVKRALGVGIEADYFLADSWFATKPIISMTLEHDLTAILRMKKNKMKYRLADKSECSAAELFKTQVKGRWQKLAGLPYQTKSIVVELNLAETAKLEPNWIKVKLVFCRGVNPDKKKGGKHDWALFLSTDASLSDEKILEIYALRWGIEVYFKEAKQHLGFLSEQSRHYSAYIASIHLTGLRFCLLLHAKQNDENSKVCDSRNLLCDSLQNLDFACKLWGLFKALISDAVSSISSLSTTESEIILNKINEEVTSFFNQVMQMDTFTLRQEAISTGKYP
ncbi:IS4 family transposase [Parashewanella spongiae]|uniref:IS4 family transposase n=1 Tax=Parashewanella spongiae TaxID=342950 RepID=UPI001FD5154F|nr:transposase [Parashewanella spongiae]